MIADHCCAIAAWFHDVGQVIANAAIVIVLIAAVLWLAAVAAGLIWATFLKPRLALVACFLALVPAETIFRLISPMVEPQGAYVHARICLFTALWLPGALAIVNILAWFITGFRARRDEIHLRVVFGLSGVWSYLFRQLRADRERRYIAPVPEIFEVE